MANKNYKITIEATDKKLKTIESFNISTKDGIFRGDKDFYFQKTVNEFGALGYIEITGNVRISGGIVNGDIFDLSPLKDLKIVGGYFDINQNDKIKTLEGLNIELVRKSLRINSNSYLENLNGLDNLEIVNGSLEIAGNLMLENINSLGALKTVGNNLSISNNRITKISNINSLVNFNGILTINSNSLLESIENSFEVIDEFDFLNIHSNPNLREIKTFNNLKRLSWLKIEGSLITNLDNFSRLESVFTIDIYRNSLLSSSLRSDFINKYK